MRSHFETLGLLPSLIGKLNAAQIQDLVNETGKALQFIFHPDRNDGETYRSTAINEAKRQLGSPFDIEEAKKRYVSSGPGTAEIKAAEGNLRILSRRYDVVEGTVSDDSRKLSEIKKRIDDDGIAGDYLTGFYSENPFGRVIPDPHGDIAYEIPIRFAPGAAIKLLTTAAMDILFDIEELSKQEDILDVDNSFEITNIKDEIATAEYSIEQCEKELKEARSRDKIEKLEHELRVSSHNLSVYQKKLEKLEQNPNSLKELQESFEEEKKKGNVTITQDGQIIYDGEETGFMAAGSTSTLAFDIKLTDKTDFSPLLVAGLELVGFNAELGKKTFGVIQKVELPKAKTRKVASQTEEEEMPAPASKERAKVQAMPSVPAHVEPMETALAVKGGGADYRKNPFEVLGILPSLVRELESSSLGTLVKHISKSLKKSLHPDAGGNEAASAEINAAAKTLENETVFEKAKAEYGQSRPGASEILEVERQIERVQKMIIAQIPGMARTKAELKAAERELAIKQKARRRFLGLMIDDAFGTLTNVHGTDAVYLRRSDGMEVAISHEGGMERLRLEKNGYDVYAVSGEEKLRIIGSTVPERFRSLEQAKEKIDGIKLGETLLHVEPTLREGSCLVGRRDGMIEALGMIESIERGMELSRKLSGKPAAKKERGKTRQSSK